MTFLANTLLTLWSVEQFFKVSSYIPGNHTYKVICPRSNHQCFRLPGSNTTELDNTNVLQM